MKTLSFQCPTLPGCSVALTQGIYCLGRTNTIQNSKQESRLLSKVVYGAKVTDQEDPALSQKGEAVPLYPVQQEHHKYNSVLLFPVTVF